MRITGATLSFIAAASIALSGCGGGGEGGGGSGGFDSPNNLPPVITGNPPTKLTAGTQYSFQPQSTDPDGDALTFSAVNLPTWATINKTSGLVSGTPAEANVGMSGMITIEVSDGKVATDLPQFRIEVTSAQAPPATVNSPPTITGTPGTQATVGVSYTFSPVGDDVDDDTLTFSITNKPSWATFTPATGMLTGTPASNNVGTTSGIVISVSDGTETVSLPAFSITVATTAPANRAPTITGTPRTSVTVGQAYTFTPTASDPDGNTLQYSITGKPSWLNFSATTGRLSGTPTAAAVGSSRMTITVTDGTLSASLAAFTLQVNAAANQPPVISGTPPTAATVGQSYTFTPTASDPEGATLTFSIVNKPSWLTFSTTNGQLTGTPTAGDVGTASGIVISANDGSALASLAAFNIVVTQTATGSVTLNWEAPTQNTDNSPLTNLAGYRITYGRSQTSLDQSINVTNAGLTTYVVPNLATGTWYFAMYAYTSTGAESDASNIATKSVN
jgi:putative Ig domain-containing protein